MDFDRRRMLKVKIKALAAEAKIIRFEERRVAGQIREDLYLHRVQVVRREARATHLAYGYLRGRSYQQLEASCVEPPDWKKIESMVKRYGSPTAIEGLKAWREPPTEECRAVA